MVQPILGGTKRTADLGRSGSDPRFGTTNINQSQRVFPHDMALVRSPVHLSRHWACQIALAVARCSCSRSRRSCAEILITESFYRDLVPKSCQEISYRVLVQKALLESLCRDLLKLARRPLLEFSAYLARPPLLEILYRDIA